jgi:acetyl esterase/lipase
MVRNYIPYFISIVLVICSLCLPSITHSQTIIPLYDKEIPNHKPQDSLYKAPHLIAYFPEEGRKPQGKAIIICPGGGYQYLAAAHEGHDVAKRLAGLGIHAFVLMYRLPDSTKMDQTWNGPLQDAQQAILWVRSHAVQWGVSRNSIGIAGFSAGGHLAASASTLFDDILVDNIDGFSARPDFSLLVYPVISMDRVLTHAGSRKNLLGAHPSQELIDQFSTEKQVNPFTPPTFLVHSKDDAVVPYDNSKIYYDALKANGVPATFFTYAKGIHGFGMHNQQGTESWFEAFIAWLETL